MRGNEVMLRQMIDNLLQNAILHGEEDGQIEINIGNGIYQIRNTYTGTLTTEDAKKLLKPYAKEEDRKRIVYSPISAVLPLKVIADANLKKTTGSMVSSMYITGMATSDRYGD